MRKTFREYKHVKDAVDDVHVDQKQKDFYENLFKAAEPGSEPAVVQNNPRKAPT